MVFQDTSKRRLKRGIIIYVKYEDLASVERISNGDMLEERIIDFRMSPVMVKEYVIPVGETVEIVEPQVTHHDYVQCVINYDTLKVLTDINELKRF